MISNRVSIYHKHGMIRYVGQLGPCETPRGNHVVRVTLLPISVRTSIAVENIEIGPIRLIIRKISHVDFGQLSVVVPDS